MMKKWIFGAASAALLASGLFFSCANSDDYDDETTKEEIVSLATLVGGSYSFTAGTATHTLSFVSETEATYAIPAYNIFQYFTYTAEESGSNEYTLKMYAHEEGETVDTATTTAEARSYVITINSFSEILIGTTTASLASPTDLIGKSYSTSVADLYEKGISVGSMSKTYSLPGLRVGWVTGREDLINEINRHRQYNTISVSALDEYFAAYALENRDEIEKRNFKILNNGLKILKSWIENEQKADKFC